MGFRKNDIDSVTGPSGELIERYLRQLMERRAAQSTPWEETDFPALDIYETEELIIAEAELPGVNPDHLEVSITAGTLVIEGLKEEILEEGRINFLCMERTFGDFRRIVPLIQSIDASRIKAVFKKGILQIQIPKAAEKRGRKRIISVHRQ